MVKAHLNTLRRFYVVKRPGLNELHSVHTDGCPFLPDEKKRIFLGKFISVSEARHEGNKYFNNNCGCRFCTTGPGEIDIKTTQDVDGKIMTMNSSVLLKYLN